MLKLLDPTALDAKVSAPRGRVSIVVPQKWLREGARLSVEVPAKIRCDLCDGGGCDACARSGAYRVEASAIEITLPRVSDDALALRVTNPFADREPALLLVRVAAGVEPSAGVRWVAENHDQEQSHAIERPNGPVKSVPQWLGWVALVCVAAALGWAFR